MVKRLLWKLMIIPVIECIVFILVGKWIGFSVAFLLLIITSAIGVLVFKKQGLKTLQAIKDPSLLQINKTNALVDQICHLLGAIALLIPGFITDLIGVLLFIPVTRNLLKPLIGKQVVRLLKGRKVIRY